ncbi:MAG: CheA signal transduction histidine kinase, partial [uncultured bacterium]
SPAPPATVRATAESVSGSSPTVLRPGQSASVWVDIARLDDLMRLVGDLVVSRSRLVEILPKMLGAAPVVIEALDMITTNFERLLRELRGAVMRVRLVPLADVFSRMPLVVRDLARESGKQIRLLFEGQETEIDKLLVDQLFDPLLHLVRNAIAHGIETPAGHHRCLHCPCR